MTDMHGLKMTGLKRASVLTKGLRGYYDPRYVELHYDTEDGSVLAVEQCSLGHNWHTYYDDKNVIAVCEAVEPMTMQEIADRIHDAVEERFVADPFPSPDERGCEYAYHHTNQ